MELRIGQKFRHKKVLDENNQPALCRITARRWGQVHYVVGDEPRSKNYFDERKAHWYVGELID